MKKATFVCAWTERGYRVLLYKYRDHTYTVQDFGQLGFSLASQHRQEQTFIDSLIEKEELSKNHQTTDAMDDFDFFFDYVNGKVDADGNTIK